MIPEIDPVGEALARTPYLEDEGFTEGVMARLPPRRRRLRGAVLMGFAAAAGGVAAWALRAPLDEALRAAAAGRPWPFLVGAVAFLAAAAALALVAVED